MVRYPIDWFQTTFYSRNRSKELLGPELANGNLTQHDYDASIDFLPASRGYLPFAYASLATGASLLFSRKRKLNSRTSAILMVVSSAGGVVLGQFRRAYLHMNYHHSLEDLDGYARAMENVNTRLGSPRPLGMAEVVLAIQKSKPPSMRGPAGAQKVPASFGDSEPDASQSSHVGWNTPDSSSELQQEPAAFERPTPPAIREAPPSAQTQSQPRASSSPKSSWDEIRAANNRGSANSSWDTLRQNERAKANPAASSASAQDDERARSQAAFDAMLEIERKRADSRAGNS